MHAFATPILGALALAMPALAHAEPLATKRDLAPHVALAPALDAQGGWQAVLEQTYNVPQGYAYSPAYDFGATPLTVDALRVEVLDAAGGRCGAGLASVDIATTPQQTLLTSLTTDQTGLLALPNAQVYKILFMLYESQPLGGTCVVRLWALPHGSAGGGGDQAAFELAGAIHYAGGFQSKLTLEVAPADVVVRVWARVPDFCQNAQVLEAGTVTEGQYDVAAPVDQAPNVFAVNGGAGSHIRAVQLTLNGPVGLACDIPVYLQKAVR